MDILITSASRPKSLKSEIETFLEYVFVSGQMKFHLHEDVVPGMEKESDELVKWAYASGVFTTIYVTNPRNGRGPGLNKLKKHANSKYLFYMEEDFDFIRPVNLDDIIKVMDKYPKINQVAFFHNPAKRIPKPGGPNGQDYYYPEERDFDGMKLNVSERWLWQPAIWRRKFIMPLWNFPARCAGKSINYHFKEGCGEKEWDCKWLEETIGSYFYEGNNNKWVKHTSWDIRHDRAYL